MAAFAGSAIFGSGLGPLCSSLIAQHFNWRWVFYAQTISCGILILLVALFFKETRSTVLLSRRARLLNKWYERRERAGLIGFRYDEHGVVSTERIRWKVKADEERETLAKMVRISVTRPFHLLITEPVVFFFALWQTFSWSVLFLTFGCIPLVFSDNHHFDIEQSGAVFTAICVGSIVATFISIYLERFAKSYGKRSNTPEGRLCFSCIMSIFLPVGLFWFGWTSFPSIHWIVPTVAVGCATMGIFSIYLAGFNYLADTYHRYASSALAAQSFARNIVGGVFPVITGAMVTNMGFPAAASLLGGLGALLTIVPWVLIFYGPRIRARSKFASVRNCLTSLSKYCTDHIAGTRQLAAHRSMICREDKDSFIDTRGKSKERANQVRLEAFYTFMLSCRIKTPHVLHVSDIATPNGEIRSRWNEIPTHSRAE